jgi:DNA-binding MarR family transcriptional regulator
MTDDTRHIQRSMNAVRGIVRALRMNTRAIELKMGISLAQLFVLQQLADRPADSLNDLADRTATHQSSVSVVVRRLVQRGLVSRTPSPATNGASRSTSRRPDARFLAVAPPRFRHSWSARCTR